MMFGSGTLWILILIGIIIFIHSDYCIGCYTPIRVSVVNIPPEVPIFNTNSHIYCEFPGIKKSF